MKKTRVPSLVGIAVLTLVTIVSWIFFSVIRIFTSKAPINIPAEVLEPLDPKLDGDSLTKIQERIFFKEGQVQTQIQIPSPTPGVLLTPKPTVPSPTATSSASPTSSPTATSSGTPGGR